MRSIKRFLSLILVTLVFPHAGWSQEVTLPEKSIQYILGSRDTVSVWARDVPEITGQNFQIDSEGFLNLPLLGRILASGFTAERLQDELVRSLKTYVVRPSVIVNVVGFRSIPVTVVGAVGNPGVHALKGSETLFEMIQSAGGPKPEASPVVRVMRKVERGPLPVPNSTTDPSGQYNVADINLKLITEGDPSVNIRIMEDDQIIVNQSPLVYIAGEVVRQGSVSADPLLGGVSVRSAISQAGGLQKTATPKNAKILRRILDGKREAEFPIDVEKIMSGNAPDVQLLPNDVLFIPGSATRQAASTVAQTMLRIGTNMLTWGLIR